MYTVIRYAGGIIVEGLVLAEGRDCLRVALAGFIDTVELRCAGARWFTADGEPVEFDFLLSDAHLAERGGSAGPMYLARAAG
jgi:hypothetical protein